MRTKIFLIGCAAVILLSACEQKKLKDAVIDPQPAGPGREETKSLEIYKPIGVDGKEVRAKVDQMLNENDKRVETLDRQIDPAGK